MNLPPTSTNLSAGRPGLVTTWTRARGVLIVLEFGTLGMSDGSDLACSTRAAYSFAISLARSRDAGMTGSYPDVSRRLG